MRTHVGANNSQKLVSFCKYELTSKDKATFPSLDPVFFFFFNCSKMMRKKQLVLVFALFGCSAVVFLMVFPGTTSESGASHTNTQNDAIHRSRDGALSTIQADSNTDDIVTVAKKVSAHNKTVLVTMVNDAYLSFTYSWLCNTKPMNIHKSVLIITTDTASKEKLERDWPEISVVAMNLERIKGDQTYSHVGYVKIMIKRTEMILAILSADLEIFLFEVDCLWFGNPVPGLQMMNGYDVLVNPVAQRTNIYAGGFLYLFTTDKAKALWKKLTEEMLALGDRISKLDDGKYISEGDNDQQYFSRLITQKYGEITVKELPLDIYADGKWYELPEDKRKTSKAIIVNNNWVLGNPAKIKRAKKWKHWFIHEDMSCDLELVNKTIHK